jgi:hypothetical protein
MHIALVCLVLVGVLMTWPFATPVAAQCPFIEEPFDFPVFLTINGEPVDRNELVGGLPRLRKVASGRRIFVIEGTFGPYVIERCPGCAGPARFVIQDNVPRVFCGSDGVNQLLLTDARIRARPDADAAQLSRPLTMQFKGFFAAVVEGSYPHGVVMDGTFGCRGTGRCVMPEGNRITVSAFGGMNAEELVKAGGRTSEPSLQFTVSTARSFAKQAIESVPCLESSLGCGPDGILKVTIQLGAAGDAVTIPGSIAVLLPTIPDDDGLALLLPAMNALLASSGTTGGTCGGSTACACGDTVMASRTLDSDPVVRSVCPADGLIVGQSNVVLTIKGGNTIRGSGAGTGILLGAGVSGVTVRSGGIAGFATGVRATGNDGGTFSGLVLRGNAEGGLDVTGSGNTIDRVIAETNGVGIAVDGDGNVVSSSRALGNDTGVAVTGNANTVSRNVVERSADRGMVVDGAGARVERNQISSSGDDGLVLTGTGHLVSRNVVKFSGGDGLVVEGGAGMTVSRNQTDRSGEFGILETAGAGGTANTYAQNVCGNAALGDSSPGGLCF